ncbi:hypothetical protein MCAMS1_00134 [biofilm metagenome]
MANKLISPEKCSLPRAILLVTGVICIIANQSVFSASEIDNKDIIDMPLEELLNLEVVSASRFKQKSSEAPSAVEVLTAEDIKSFNWRTLADALNAIRGLTVRNDRNYTSLGVRGFSRSDFGSKVLIMVDGRRLNDTVFDQAFLGEEFLLDMSLIDRIEYNPGSGSAVYGANAVLGVVNVITKTGKGINGLRISGEAGSLDTYRGRASISKTLDNGVDVLLQGSHYFSHGADKLFFPEFANVNGGIAEDSDLERSSRLFGRVSYKDFTLRSGYVDRFKRVPTAAFGAVFGDKGFESVDTQAYVDLDYNTQINPELGLEARGFYHWYDYHSLLTLDSDEGAPVRLAQNYDAVHSNWWGGEIKLIGTQFEHHKWITGVDVQFDERQHLINFDVNPFTPFNDKNSQGWRIGVYAQDEYRITNDFRVNLGLRLDHHHRLKSLQLNPRIGLIWDILPSLTTKFVYGSAFRAPNALEQDLVIQNVNSANSNNREEKIKSYEATVEWRPEQNVKLMGTFFHNYLTQILEQNPNNQQFQNIGSFKSYGFELQGDKRWDNGRLLKLSWTHQYARESSPFDSHWAVDSPKNLVKFHYAEPLFDDQLRIGFEEIFVDERLTLRSNRASGYHLFNINLALAKPFYGIQASLGIYNVLDQRYKVVGGTEHIQDTLAADGRTVRFRLEYGFQ